MSRPRSSFCFITFAGVKLAIDYTYHPYYRGVYEKGGGQISPDEPAHVEIEEVKVAGTDISLYNLFDQLDAIRDLEAEIPLEDER